MLTYIIIKLCRHLKFKKKHIIAYSEFVKPVIRNQVSLFVSYFQIKIVYDNFF